MTEGHLLQLTIFQQFSKDDHVARVDKCCSKFVCDQERDKTWMSRPAWP